MRETKVLRHVVLLSCFTLLTTLALAQNQSPVLLVALKAESSVVVVDPLEGKVIGRVPIGENPHMVATSQDGKFAYATSQEAGTLSVIDVAARKEVRRVNLGPGSRPHGVVAVGGKVYLTEDGYKLIACYDPAKNQMDWMLGIGQDVTDEMLAVTKDGNRVFTTNSVSENIVVSQRASTPPDWHISTIKVGKGPHSFDISPDGKELWVAAQLEDGNVSIIDVATLKVIQTFSVKMKDSHRLTFTPDGKRVLISDRKGNELVIVDAATRKEIKRVKLDIIPTEIQVVPDSSRVYVSSASGDNATNMIAIVDLQTMEVMKRFSPGTHPEGMAWAEGDSVPLRR